MPDFVVLDEWLLVQVLDHQRLGLVRGEQSPGGSLFIFDPHEVVILHVDVAQYTPLADHQDDLREMLVGCV